MSSSITPLIKETYKAIFPRCLAGKLSNCRIDGVPVLLMSNNSMASIYFYLKELLILLNCLIESKKASINCVYHHAIIQLL